MIRSHKFALEVAKKTLERTARILDSVEEVVKKYASEHTYHDMNFADVMKIHEALKS
jgi:hypothetical protein